MMREIKKEYSNSDITVVWKPHLCMHSTKCWKALLPVFDPRRKPWIDMKAAATAEIIKAVNNCPSQALSYYSSNRTSNAKDQD